METEVKLTTERLKADAGHLKEWLSKNPHLPRIEDDEWLITFLHHNKYSLEKTKIKLDNYYTIRNIYPEVLKNRDPIDPDIIQAGESFGACFANRLSKHSERIFFVEPRGNIPTFHFNHILKRGSMLIETLYLERDRHDYLSCVIDCQYGDYTLFLKGIPAIKKSIDIFFKAYSERIKAIHVVNIPPHLYPAFHTAKEFFPTKITERLYIHASSEELCKVVDENVICRDFGGKGPSLAEYEEFSQKLMEKHRDWYLEQNDVSANERLRRRGDYIADMKGSFRKLEFD